jgi:UDP-N-acetylglucosamine:LPS N-acetylglucosamine transferase
MARIDHSFCKSLQQNGSPKIGKGLCILFGGSNGVKKLNDLHELYLDKLEWKKILCEGPTPSGRFGHTCCLE